MHSHAPPATMSTSPSGTGNPTFVCYHDPARAYISLSQSTAKAAKDTEYHKNSAVKAVKVYSALLRVDATVEGRVKVKLPVPTRAQTPEHVKFEFWIFPDMIPWIELLRLLRKYVGYPVTLKEEFSKPAMIKLLIDLGLTEDRFCDLNEDDKRTLAEERLNEDPDRIATGNAGDEDESDSDLVIEILDSSDEESSASNEVEFLMAENGER